MRNSHKTLAQQKAINKVGGRPHNVFSMSPAAYKLWQESRAWGLDPEEHLQFGGAVGMTKNGQFVLDLLRVHQHLSYVYVRLRSHDGSVDFAFPSAMRLSQLKRLLEVWELEDIKWAAHELMGLESYPKALWTFPTVLGRATPQEAWFLTYEGRGPDRQVALHHKAGWGTSISKNNLDRRLITLMGPGLSTVKKLLDVVKVDDPGVFDPALQQKVVSVCLDIGADYFERKLLKPSAGKLTAFTPHAHLIAINPANMSELSL